MPLFYALVRGVSTGRRFAASESGARAPQSKETANPATGVAGLAPATGSRLPAAVAGEDSRVSMNFGLAGASKRYEG